MKKIAVVSLLLAVCAGLYANLPELYRQRLENSLEYKRAQLQLAQARLKLRQIEKVYIPYVDIGGGVSRSEISVENGLLQPFSILLNANFRNVLGADISVSFPFTWDADSGAGVDFPAVSVSRELFTETKTELMAARATVMKQEHTVEALEMTLWAELLKEICDYSYYLDVQAIQKAYAGALERQLSAVRDETAIRALKKQWYSMRKNLLESESSIKALSFSKPVLSAADVPALYQELSGYLESLDGRLPNPSGLSAEDKLLASLKLSFEAAKRQAGFWVLPYLPNPVFSAGITYDKDTQAVDWSVSVGFSVPIIDRGERSSQSLSRKTGAELAKIELEQAGQRQISLREQAWNKKELLWLDYELAELSAEEKEEASIESEQLFKNGFLSMEEYTVKQMDFKLAALERQKSRNSYLIQLLGIMQAYGLNDAPKED